MHDPSGSRGDVASHWLWEYTGVAVGEPYSLFAAVPVWPSPSLWGSSNSLCRPPVCSCLGLLSLASLPKLWRSTSGSVSVAGLSPCPTFRPSLRSEEHTSELQ